MKRSKLLLIGLVSFGAGVFISSHRAGPTLKDSVSAAESQRHLTAKNVIPTTALSAGENREARISEVLSALQETNYLKQRHALFEALGDLTAADLSDLIARAEQMPPRFRGPLLEAVVGRWLELDLNGARTWIRAHPTEQAYWHALARFSPTTAFEEVHANPGSTWAADTMQRAANFGAGLDGKAQATLFASLPSDRTRNMLLAAAVGAWAQKDGADSFHFARNLPPGDARTTAMETALKAWAKTDPLRAMTETSGILSELSNGVRGNDAIAEVAAAAFGKDAGAALQWAEQLPDAHRATAYQAIAQTWAKQDPVAALDWSLANGVNIPPWLIGEAMSGDATQTIGWIQSLSDEGERARLLESALRAKSKLTSPPVSEENVNTIMGLLSQLSPETQERVAARLGFMNTVSRFDELQQWIDRLPSPALRSAAIDGAARSSFNPNDPLSEGRILAAFPTGADRDAALHGIVSRQIYNPAQAGQTALKINDTQMRFQALDDFVPYWIEREPDQARAWLNRQTSIPAEWRAIWLPDQ